MRIRPLLAACLIAGVLLAPLAGPAAASGGVRLTVFGDTGVTSATRQNVDAAVREGATGFVGLGDYYYWDSPSTWKDMFRPLTRGGAYLALGNHDDLSALAEYFPEGPTWSHHVSGARFVAINTDARMDVGSAQHARVRGALCGASEDVRVLVMHKPWWLGPEARHPGSEFPGSASAMDAMVRECGVDLVLAGHEHNYQRLVRNGVPYLVVGTGGQSEYAVAGAPSGTVATYKGHGRLLLDVSADGLRAEFRSLDGRVRDTFASGSGSGASSEPRFSASGGNEWWAQVRVEGASVRAVEARDDDTSWKPLSLRDWGAWAGSLHVEPGHRVQYRASLADGRVVESCWHAHPGGAPECAASAPAFSASFRTSGGNAWWVAARVDASQPVAGVDARVNGGAWRALSLRSWGEWATSMHAPDGSLVEFRARSASGAEATSGAYRWPGGAPADEAGAFQVVFGNPRGNAWWVETDARASGGTLAGVEARVDGGAWTALAKTDWGSWAKSMRAPEGSLVELRARSTTGATSATARHAWVP